MSFFNSDFINPNFIIPISQKMPIYSGKINSEKSGYAYKISGNDENSTYSFSDVFKNAVKDVVDTDKEYVNKQYLLATGQIDNAADVTISASKAQLAVDLLVQMRNSALTAYNEILRINV